MVTKIQIEQNATSNHLLKAFAHVQIYNVSKYNHIMSKEREKRRPNKSCGPTVSTLCDMGIAVYCMHREVPDSWGSIHTESNVIFGGRGVSMHNSNSFVFIAEGREN